MQIPGQARAIRARALDPDPHDRTETAQPIGQLAITGRGRGERLHPQQSADAVQRRRHMHVQMSVDPARDRAVSTMVIATSFLSGWHAPQTIGPCDAAPLPRHDRSNRRLESAGNNLGPNRRSDSQDNRKQRQPARRSGRDPGLLDPTSNHQQQQGCTSQEHLHSLPGTSRSYRSQLCTWRLTPISRSATDHQRVEGDLGIRALTQGGGTPPVVASRPPRCFQDVQHFVGSAVDQCVKPRCVPPNSSIHSRSMNGRNSIGRWSEHPRSRPTSSMRCLVR